MADLSLSLIAERTEGKILQGSPSLSFNGFSIDSRETKPGELFFALVAERNGHEFVTHAARRGARGAVISQNVKISASDFGLLWVEDTLEALQRLAQTVLLDHPVRVVGITGSIGKTTTKEFTASLLSRHYNVLKSKGNYNNQIGLPLSVLALNERHNLAVLEMGMNHPGEIKLLTRLAPPDVAVITNINPVHLEFFDNMEAIAAAKKEILLGAKDNAVAVLNGDDSRIKAISADWKGQKILFGLSKETDIRAENIRTSGSAGLSLDLVYGWNKARVNVPFFYETYLYNFLAAAGTARALSVPLDDILTQAPGLTPLPMRGTLLRRDKITVVDDSYNSNPIALESALKDSTRIAARRRVAVLGDMLELGVHEAHFHREAGRQAAAAGWDVLVTIGERSRAMVEGALEAGMSEDRIYSFADSEEAAEKIWSIIREGDLILVKGSRGIKTERILERFKEEGF